MQILYSQESKIKVNMLCFPYHRGDLPKSPRLILKVNTTYLRKHISDGCDFFVFWDENGTKK